MFQAGITLVPLCLPLSCREKQGVGGCLAVTQPPLKARGQAKGHPGMLAPL